jgi:regulator of PEP synthase PpsR (kinase-PPPase family)
MMAHSHQHLILIVSDGTGHTAENVTKAALMQFENAQSATERRPEVRTREQVSAVVLEARDKKAMIVHTLVSPELRRHLYMESTFYQVIAVDLMGSILDEMGAYLKATPHLRPGLFYGDESYFRRVDAIEYTVQHDDGQGVSDLPQADIVLVGISRTSKTPVSIFLAYRGYRVANIPIVLDLPLPNTIDQVAAGRIVALVIDPQRLLAIRHNRLRQYPGLTFTYADMDHIRQELRYSRKIFAERSWPAIDVSGRAVEETAREVLNLVDLGENEIGTRMEME